MSSGARPADSARLASYLTVGVAGAVLATPQAEAAVVAINLTSLGTGTPGVNVTATNGGVGAGNYRDISNWLGVGTGTLKVFNGLSSVVWGLAGGYGLQFANLGSDPKNFSYGAWITDGGPAASTFTGSYGSTSFKNPTTSVSPDFGAGSFMGFRFGSGANWNYGYLEVTWTASTNTFQILSGAYESTVNNLIVAGATPTPVPAPSALALLALGGGAFRRARARAA